MTTVCHLRFVHTKCFSVLEGFGTTRDFEHPAKVEFRLKIVAYNLFSFFFSFDDLNVSLREYLTGIA